MYATVCVCVCRCVYVCSDVAILFQDAWQQGNMEILIGLLCDVRLMQEFFKGISISMLRAAHLVPSFWQTGC